MGTALAHESAAPFAQAEGVRRSLDVTKVACRRSPSTTSMGRSIQERARDWIPMPMPADSSFDPCPARTELLLPPVRGAARKPPTSCRGHGDPISVPISRDRESIACAWQQNCSGILWIIFLQEMTEGVCTAIAQPNRVIPHVSPALVVLCGPPLPGRRAFGRALAHQLGAEHRLAWSHSESPEASDPVQRLLDSGACVVIEGEFATLTERRRLLSSLIAAERILVEWMCPRAEAEREIFHRFAGRAPSRAEAELARYLEDQLRREPISDELEARAVVRIGARAPLGDQVLAVVAALAPRALVSPPPPRRPRVLVLERDDDERMDLADTLRELGCQVLCAADGEAAQNLLAAGAAIDLVFIGDQLSDMEGPDLLCAFEALRPDLRVVLLMSRHASRRVHGMFSSAIEVLEKPAHFVDLERLVDEASPV